MAANKNKLEQFLPDKLARPELRRGRGVHLTTEPEQEVQQVQKPINTETQEDTNVEIQKPSNLENQPAKVMRRQPGWELRVDLIKATQRIAIDDDRYNYEIVEEALMEYLQKRGRI